MKKILIFSLLALFTTFLGKNKVSAEQNTCQEFEEISSLNSKFKTKGIWNNDNWTAKAFEICNTSVESKDAIKISYYNASKQNRYVNSPSFNQKKIISPGKGKFFLCPIKNDLEKNEKLYSASISPVFIPEQPDTRELGIVLLSITEVRLKC